MPAARRFPDLGLRIDRDLPPLDPVGGLTRTPRGSEAGSPQSCPDEVRPEST